MPFLDLPDHRLHWREDGDPGGAPVVFAHGLGTRLELWDEVIAALPAGFRLIRYDLRGHGLSGAPPAPWSMGAFVRDAERLLDHLGLRDCIFIGHSLGGMLAQGLAVKRLDLVRGLVLSGTATKIGTAETWAARAGITRADGMEAVAEAELARWFPRFAQKSKPAGAAREMLLSMRPESYLAACGAIAGTDFYATTARLTLPALVLAGANDGATPPDMLRETADLMAGADFVLLRGAGHLAALDRPEDLALQIDGFLARVGHALHEPGPRTPIADCGDGCGCGSDHDSDHHHGGCGHSH
ncbi:alpha/beta fold hydrolase [Falsigemmobacter faecalis]|uniref:Alpha/beta fold hydrolase n=1 Tax=Falsigemmobacter faecalis TaxID=2488730 RepID=A0A3P3DT02_9RHOB|nr:alpha/beta fold hydrolase [Falsigemmobacter faecalis]RRH77349.1 alpha/beta fold hydrolase [Falsigemmobacter faecalis]